MRGAALVLFTFVSACSSDLRFACDDDPQCVRAGVHGRCADSPWSAARYCVFADPSCPSGSRWDRTAGDGLKRACLDAELRDGGGEFAIDEGSDQGHRDAAAP